MKRSFTRARTFGSTVRPTAAHCAVTPGKSDDDIYLAPPYNHRHTVHQRRTYICSLRGHPRSAVKVPFPAQCAAKYAKQVARISQPAADFKWKQDGVTDICEGMNYL